MSAEPLLHPGDEPPYFILYCELHLRAARRQRVSFVGFHVATAALCLHNPWIESSWYFRDPPSLLSIECSGINPSEHEDWLHVLVAVVVSWWRFLQEKRARLFSSGWNFPCDRLCGLVVRVLGYRSGGPGSIPGTIRKKSSGSGTGSTQLREYNWVATW
jgi:hypothetical protein